MCTGGYVHAICKCYHTLYKELGHIKTEYLKGALEPLGIQGGLHKYQTNSYHLV